MTEKKIKYMDSITELLQGENLRSTLSFPHRFLVSNTYSMQVSNFTTSDSL